LSRATSDLSTIRRFFGFGAIFLVVSSLQITTVLLLLLTLYWQLGIVVAVTMTPVAWLAKRFGNRYGDISRRMQDQTGDLGTLLDFLPNLTMAAVVLLGVLAVARGRLSLGALVAFTSLLVLLQWPVIDLGWILSVAQEAATAAQRIYEVFDEAPLVADRPGAS